MIATNQFVVRTLVCMNFCGLKSSLQTCFTGVDRGEMISVLIDGATVIFSPVEEFWLNRKCYKRAIAILDPDRTAEKTVARYGQIQR